MRSDVPEADTTARHVMVATTARARLHMTVGSAGAWFVPQARAAVVLCCASALVLSGCAGGDTPGRTPMAGFAQEVAAAIDEAASANAGEAQLEALEQAASSGTVDVELVRSAAHETVTCISNQGWDARFVEETDAAGVVLPGFSVSVEDEDLQGDPAPAIDGCERIHMFWLNQIYTVQPSNQELVWAHIREREPALRECLAENGHPVEADDPLDVVLEGERRLFEEPSRISCLREAGIDGY